MEMGRKKREAKATYCRDRVRGQESLQASVGPLQLGWIPIVGLDPDSWVGKHGRRLGVGEEDDEDGKEDDGDEDEEEGDEGHVLRGQSVGSGEPPGLGWTPTVGLDPYSWVGPLQLGLGTWNRIGC